MTTLRQAAEEALEALETLPCGDSYKTHNATVLLIKALAEQEQDLREFGVAVAKAIAADEDFKMTFEQIVDEVMEKNT